MNREPFIQITQQLFPQSKLLDARPLLGGMSATMTALTVQQLTGHVKKLVVRQPNEWSQQHNPQAVANEFKILQTLQASNIAAPAPYYLDESSQILPTPYLVQEYIEGESEYAPANPTHVAQQIATQLAKIHQINSSNPALTFLHKQIETPAAKLKRRLANLSEPSQLMSRIAETLTAVWPLLSYNKPTLLHGDFWPGNMLWREGKLIAIVDWEDAAIGDPLEDFAISRFDICFIYGRQALEAFTQTYKSSSQLNFTHLPYWDLYAALRIAPLIPEIAAGWPELGRPDLTEEAIRDAYRYFITQAFTALRIR